MLHEPLRSLQTVATGPEAEHLRRIRLVATDVDGTLTTGGAIDPDVVASIARLVAAGIEVLPVSGRSSGEVAGLVRYLPGVRRGIAENGLVLLAPDERPRWLGPEPNRSRLKEVAERLNVDHGAELRLAPDDPFRLGDVAYERDGRDEDELVRLREAAERHGVWLIWSSVHVHLTPVEPDKGAAVLALARADALDPELILTVGDAPNDAGLFRANRFGATVGTADVAGLRAYFPELPQFATRSREGAGFMEVVDLLLRLGGSSSP